MVTPRTDGEVLDVLVQAMVDDVNNTSDEDIRREFEEEGGDMSLETEEMRALLLNTIKIFRETNKGK